MSLVDEIREYVNEHDPSNGETATIGGVERKFICDDEGFIEFVLGQQYRAVALTSYVFAKKMEISPEFHTDGHLRGKIWLRNIIVLENIMFKNFKFDYEFVMEIESAETAEISFINCHIADKLKIRNVELGDYEKEQQSKAKINRVIFAGCSMANSNQETVPYVRFGFLSVDIFSVKNIRIPVGGELNIGECCFNNFSLSNVRNLGKLKLYRINSLTAYENSNNAFQIDNTSIGDADFIHINLAAFKGRKIFDNILHGIKYANVQWESSRDVDVDQFNKDTTTEMEKKRDTYRSLKFVAKQNEDQPQALAFYAKEMKYHREVIKRTTNWFSLDRVILWFNYCTNNFGQNWTWPIGWIFLLGIVFYVPLLLSSQACFCDWENWGKFFVFLNPTHETKFIGTSWGFLAYGLDLFFRVVEGSLIYQAIQAFRRYSRSF